MGAGIIWGPFIMKVRYPIFKHYSFSMLLLLSISLGGIAGFIMGKEALFLKPLGDVFLNLMFTVVIPLVFFSIASSVASIGQLGRIGKIIFAMFSVFLFMGVIAAVYTLIVASFFHPADHFHVVPPILTHISIPTEHHFLNLLTVSDLPKLFSRENMLALIIFSFLLGCAVSVVGEKGKPFAAFLEAGMAVFVKLTTFIMYYAPIGFFAYFAVLIGDLGPKLVGAYYRVGVIYYLAGFFYFFVVFTFFAWLSNRKKGIRTFWENALPPAITGLATCSSAASIPVNLETVEKMGVPPEICHTVVPIGMMIHKQGSIMGGIFKIVFLFSFYHMPLHSPQACIIATMVALLVGTVMGAIPSGGMLGEMLIISVYGFPPEALMLIAVISIIIDPPATMLNVTGNTVASMLVQRFSFKSVR